MPAIPLPWADWYAAERAALGALVAGIPHPAGAVTCGPWLVDLEAAATAGRHSEAAQLGARIRRRVELERGWYGEGKRQ